MQGVKNFHLSANQSPAGTSRHLSVGVLWIALETTQTHEAWSLPGGPEGTRPLEGKVLTDGPLGFTPWPYPLA